MDVISVVNQTGFPIAFALMMFWLVNTTIKKNTEAIDKLKEVILKLK